MNGSLQGYAFGPSLIVHSILVSLFCTMSLSTKRSSPGMSSMEGNEPQPKRPAIRHDFDSKLGLLLVKNWAWGHKSAPQLQAESAAAYEDQITLLQNLNLSADFASKTLQKLASLGTWGKHQHNIKSELVKMLGEPCFPEPSYHPTPMLVHKHKATDAEGQTVKMVDFPVVLPHAFLSFIYKHHHTMFVQQYLGGDASCSVLEKFWTEVEKRGDPRLKGHDFSSRPDWKRKAVPIMVHGDAVPCLQIGRHATKSYDVFSMQPVLGSGSTLDQKAYIYGNFPTLEAGEDTMFSVWQRVMWSFWFCYLGQHPTVEWQSKQPYPAGSVEASKAGAFLAAGLFFVIWSIKADLEHLARFFGLPHYGSNNPCVWCPCQAGKDALFEMLYSNFTKSARWMKQIYSHKQWHELNPDAHYLFQMLYLSGLNVDPDELHSMHLGTSMHFLGSILWLLCFEILPGNPTSNMQKIWQLICENYRKLDTQCQFNNLNLTFFCVPNAHDKDYPKLKGKGAEVKDLMEPMLLVWQQFMRPGNKEDKHVLSALQCMCHLQSILSEHKGQPFLPMTIAKRFTGLVNRFLQDYSLLANYADENSKLLFNVVPKHHALYHLGQRSQFLNPRLGNTMIDEDFVGICKDIVAACANGTEGHLIPARFLEKYMWGKHLQWEYGL